MKVWKSPLCLSSPTVVTVGSFDGMHLGHQKILSEVIMLSSSLKLKSVVVTFDPHPLAVLQGDHIPNLLTTLDEKIDLLKTSGIDIAVVIKFTSKLANKEADWFIKRVLVSKLKMRRLVIGYDFRFGKDKKGDVTCLESLGTELGFGVDIIPPVTYSGFPISSTRIRTAIVRGDMEAASHMLGRPYWFSGKVIKGEGRGKLLEFPTANLAVEGENKIMPPSGVYAAKVQVGKTKIPGALYIGRKPTFGGHCSSVEIHLIGHNRVLYGKRLTVEVVSRLRDEVAFKRVEDLKQTIATDVNKVLRIWQN